MTNKKVKKIEATKPTLSAQYSTFTRKRKVAAYARVSTAKEEQENSFDAQVSYYTQKIQANPEWVFVEVYSDEGITGTNTKKREGFNRMIEDAIAGKIDLILTKSVSRFARNTVDSLVTIRQLKEKGVEVFFEKENIYTLDAKGELLLTIMSSLAPGRSKVDFGEHLMGSKKVLRRRKGQPRLFQFPRLRQRTRRGACHQ